MNRQLTVTPQGGQVANVAQVQPTYDAVGNVATVTTTLAAIPGVAGTGGTETQAFCYDEQDRLVWASTQASGSCGTVGSESLSGAGYTASYSYDPIGRIANQSVTTSGGSGLSGTANGGYVYGDAAHFHAVTAVGQNGTPSYSAAYDAAGDMTCRALNSYSCNNSPATGQKLTYDALRRLVSWQNGSSSSEQYAYDGEGNRVWRQTTNGSTTTTTVSILGVEDVKAVSGGSTTATRYYALPGGVSATRDASGLVYEASDQLGTPIASLNLATGITGEQMRAPYGQARYAANGTGSGGGMRTPFGFTGQREDTAPSGASGLDYFNARMYDSATGRFTSADDAQPGLGDPGGQDNYAYVGGMVENATDPSGHEAFVEDRIQGGITSDDATQAAVDWADEYVRSLSRTSSDPTTPPTSPATPPTSPVPPMNSPVQASLGLRGQAPNIGAGYGNDAAFNQRTYAAALQAATAALQADTDVPINQRIDPLWKHQPTTSTPPPPPTTQSGGSGGSTPPHAPVSNGCGCEWLYRGLGPHDDPSAGLYPYNPTGRIQPLWKHIRFASLPQYLGDQYISLTKDPFIALNKYGSRGAVRIDPEKVVGNLIDVSTSEAQIAAGVNPEARTGRFAAHDSEVLLEGYIPPEAISPYNGPEADGC